MDLRTRYMGLELVNPLVVGSSGLTQSVEKIKGCETAGAGAVVLKSIFEEEILGKVRELVKSSEPSSWHTEGADYLQHYGREDAVSDYLALIRDAKRAVAIPVIASINCQSLGSWIEYAQRIEAAGADALELNVFVMPSDTRLDAAEHERLYFEIAKGVKAQLKIPVALKFGSFCSGLAHTVRELSYSGIDALVLFNRFYRFDFDIDHFRLVPARVLSHPVEMAESLRWISILSGRVGCSLAASTGVHDGVGLVKQLLAGADAVQVCSVLYQNDVAYLGVLLDELKGWMDRQGFDKLSDFQGRMRQADSPDPRAYERVQFMKAVSSYL